MTIAIRPAAEFGLVALTEVLNASYRDYPVVIDFQPDQYEFFVRSHDVDLTLSVVAEEHGKLLGLAQLARRDQRGWVAGLGVRPEYRCGGIGRALMRALIDSGGTAGLRTLQLEVLQENNAALALYTSLGWRITRELLVWRWPHEKEPLPIPFELLTEHDPADLLATYFAWHDQPPCWQRQRATIERFLDVGMRGWAIVRDNQPVSYLLGFPPRNGQLSLIDVAVNPVVGIRSAGRPLIQALHLKFPGVVPTLNNEPVDSKLNPLFAAMAYHVVRRQHEMELRLE